LAALVLAHSVARAGPAGGLPAQLAGSAIGCAAALRYPLWAAQSVERRAALRVSSLPAGAALSAHLESASAKSAAWQALDVDAPVSRMPKSVLRRQARSPQPAEFAVLPAKPSRLEVRARLGPAPVRAV